MTIRTLKNGGAHRRANCSPKTKSQLIDLINSKTSLACEPIPTQSTPPPPPSLNVIDLLFANVIFVIVVAGLHALKLYNRDIISFNFNRIPIKNPPSPAPTHPVRRPCVVVSTLIHLLCESYDRLGAPWRALRPPRRPPCLPPRRHVRFCILVDLIGIICVKKKSIESL